MLRRTIAATLEQALATLPNLFLSLAFARWLTPEGYGSFAVVFSIYMLIMGLQTALVVEPMLIFEPRRPELFRERLSAFAMQHLLVCVLLAIPLVAAGLLAPRDGVRRGLLVLGVGLPAILGFHTFRRMAWVLEDSATTVASSAVFAAVCLGGLGLAAAGFARTPWAPFAIIAVASLAACIAPLTRYELRGGKLADARRLLSDYWPYAKWALGTAVVFWMANTSLPALLAARAGLSEAGVLRGAENFLLPLGQLSTVGAIVLLPWWSRQFGGRGTSLLRSAQMRSAMLVASLTAFLGSAAYSLVAVAAARYLAPRLYEPYLAERCVPVLTLLATTAVIRAVIDFGVRLPLRSQARGVAVFLSTLAGAIGAWACGYYWMASRGAQGAAEAALASVLIQTAVVTIALIVPGRNGNKEPSNG